MKTKEILTERDCYLDISLLLEINQREIIDIIGKDDYDSLIRLNKKASQDQNFLKVIVNTYKAGQGHSIEDILGLYQNYTRFIAQRWNQGQEAFIDVPGGLRTSLIPDTTTYDVMLKFIDASLTMVLKTKAYVNCLKQGPVNSDFEVIINDNKWIVCYPKTIKGSISLARSFWNGSELEYDKSVNGGIGSYIGSMTWCTSIVSGGNMFLNYHRAKNLHMYYCIKKNMHVKDIDRKLCISFKKEDDEVSLVETNASVDANNKLTTEEQFKSYIGNRFDILRKDVEKPKRLEIDEQAYYESISLKQYKLLRAANEENLEDFEEELIGILDYSRDRKKILLLALKDKHTLIAAQHGHLLEADPTGKIIKQLANNKNEDIRCAIAVRKDLLGADSTGELIKKLANDKNKNVRSRIAYREDLLEADPSGKLIKKLANDENEDVRCSMAGNQNLLQLDPSGRIIKQLTADENHNVRMYIAYREDLLEADPSGRIIKKLANDENEDVRMYIASNQNLLQADPSGEIIKKLANDENRSVRLRIATNRSHDIQNFLVKINESLLKSYIKTLLD